MPLGYFVEKCLIFVDFWSTEAGFTSIVKPNWVNKRRIAYLDVEKIIFFNLKHIENIYLQKMRYMMPSYCVYYTYIWILYKYINTCKPKRMFCNKCRIERKGQFLYYSALYLFLLCPSIFLSFFFSVYLFPFFKGGIKKMKQCRNSCILSFHRYMDSVHCSKCDPF